MEQTHEQQFLIPREATESFLIPVQNEALSSFASNFTERRVQVQFLSTLYKNTHISHTHTALLTLQHVNFTKLKARVWVSTCVCKKDENNILNLYVSKPLIFSLSGDLVLCSVCPPKVEVY